ncbi:AAA family ATPase [Tumebacillus permanentifrigoris]|uniref:Stage V sporulation protein K n=1 Tax=Tumebacillus permanentifrigoris TaxID=378543 RepID=A0A316DCI1_9BACL|nr:AAA family ATPase [Tumebacillus permanentifrigoris]PWK15684.1 stage V sporulation protein K [Tumebacillus permanentifrigoris]
MRSGNRTPNQRENDQDVLDQFRKGEVALNEALRRLHGSSSNSTLRRETKGQPAVVDTQRYQAIIKELDTLIGLKQVKTLVKEIFAFIQIQQKRSAAKLATEPIVLHMIFKGNPGTGKTTVARILARLMRELGVLSKGHLVEVERADLVGEYIGHTAQKTREHVKKALGGIMFIDEAYSLARGGEKDFGKEAIDCLVKSMEDHKNDFILILAGYGLEMEQFLRTNPGLPSRFPIIVHFEDYSEHELMQIADTMLRHREYRLSHEANVKLRHFLRDSLQATGRRNFSNARMVRNIIERAIRLHAVRLLEKERPSREELMRIEPDDLVMGEELKSEELSRDWENQRR